MREAFFALDQANWTEDMQVVVNKLGVTEDDIGHAAVSLTEAHQYFTNVRDITCADDALKRADWYRHDAGVRNLIYARVGEVLLGGFFVALRDVSQLGDESLMSKEIADLVAAGRMILQHSISSANRPLDVDQILSLQAELDGVRTALAETKRLREEDEDKHRDNIRHTVRSLKGTRCELADCKSQLGQMESMGFFSRLLWLFKPTIPEAVRGEEKESDEEG
jgi:hypothetical protein